MNRLISKTLVFIVLCFTAIMAFSHTRSTSPTYAQSTFDCTQVTDIPTIECEALVALYNATAGDNWNVGAKDGWLVTTTSCSWDGISCTGGTVTAVNRGFDGLDGSVPAEVGNLTNLTSLELYSNQLTMISPEVGNLTSLTELNLSHNRLTMLPAEIGNLTNLTSLELYNNQLMMLPAEIGNLTNLTSLSLQGNQLTIIPAEIGNLTNLTGLYLDNNQLTMVPAEIGNLINLTSLDLRRNKLTTLPPEIGNLTSLTSLDLGNHGWLDLEGNQFTTFPPEVGNLTNLTWLSLDNNQLTTIPPEILNLTSLTQLNLRYNQLITVPAEIGNLTNLTSLNMGKNPYPVPIDVANVSQILPAEIGDLTNLTSLYLDNNQLATLPAEMGNLTNLTNLQLQNNPFTSWPSWLPTLTNVSSLYVGGLCDPDDPAVQAWIDSIPNVSGPTTGTPCSEVNNGFVDCNATTGIVLSECEALVAFYNSTNGDNWRYDVDTFTSGGSPWLQSSAPCSWYGVTCTNEHVTALRLSGSSDGNRIKMGLSGDVPPEIANLMELTSLNLNGNQLTSIPAEISDLQNLTNLSLAGNELTTIPPEIGTLSNLTTLLFGSSPIGGNPITTVPPEIGNLVNLTYLGLEHNELTTLPPEIGNLSSLESLYLYGNNLTTLPPEIGDLSSLRLLYANWNELVTIPPEIGTLSNLRTLLLFGNQIETVPPEISNLSNLEDLSLDGNQLTQVPSELGNLTNLNRLSLSNNQLTELPAELGNLTNVNSLPFHNNQLTELPSQFANLSNLTSFDLSQNLFTTWPFWLPTMTNISWLNVDGMCDPDDPAIQTWIDSIPTVVGSTTGVLCAVGNDIFDCSVTTGIVLSECEALVTIHTNMSDYGWEYSNGNSSGDEWLETTTPCSWYGISCENEHVTEINLSTDNSSQTIGVTGELPGQINAFTNLTDLNLTNNKITALPSQIGDLANLVHLDLRGNWLTTLPAQIGELASLKDLEVDNNRITSIPPEIGNITTLDTVRLNSNQLTVLPSEIWNPPNLRRLYLHDNWLNTFPEIPATIGTQDSLNWLMLHDNPLMSWPASYVNLTDVTNLGVNDLCRPASAQIQAWIDSTSNLSGQLKETVCTTNTTNGGCVTASTRRAVRWSNASPLFLPMLAYNSQMIGSVQIGVPATPIPPTPIPPEPTTSNITFVKDYLPLIQRSGHRFLSSSQRSRSTNRLETRIFTLEFAEGFELQTTYEFFVTEDGVPTILRDDGCGVDDVANDGIYNAEVELTDEEVILVDSSPDPFGRTPQSISIDDELMMRNISIVEDFGGNGQPGRVFDLCAGPGGTPIGNPDGVWAFKSLMMNIAGTTDEAVAADFVESWLQTWTETQTIPNNVDTAPNRSTINNLVLSGWEKENGRLDLDLAPFRLLAIVPRLDLRVTPTTLANGSAGEFRFVWGVLNSQACSEVPRFTVIFEYGVPANNMTEIKEWAADIHSLNGLFGEVYRQRLEELSTQITDANADPSKPNGSAINQVRTNELALSNPWELREFVLDGTSTASMKPLALTTVKQNPREGLQNSDEIVDFITDNEQALTWTDPFVGEPAPFHEIPEELIGIKSRTPFSREVVEVWGNTVSPELSEARHQLGLNTCSGCHRTETGTLFTMIKPRSSGVQSVLAAFLAGDPTSEDGRHHTNDPFDDSDRDFNDLDRRQKDLNLMLNSTRYELALFNGLIGRKH